MPKLELQSQRPAELIDITGQLQELVPPDLAEGSCLITAMHTTAGITVNEHADPDVALDLLDWLDRVAPRRHNTYRHAEGNSAAHIKAMLVGTSQAVPVRDGRLLLGRWQAVYFCEFDGPRRRQIEVRFGTACSLRQNR